MVDALRESLILHSLDFSFAYLEKKVYFTYCCNARFAMEEGQNLGLLHLHCLKITQNVAFEFWHFPPIFVLLKLIGLVTLFDRKLQLFKNSPFLAFLIYSCPLKM